MEQFPAHLSSSDDEAEDEDILPIAQPEEVGSGM